jgi:hypothetical protein
MPNLYKKILKADQTNTEGGYKNVVLFAPSASFLSLKKPVVGATPALGDRSKITTDHTFTSPNGFYSWLCTKHSVTVTGETNGTEGAKSIVWKAKFNLLGDNNTTQEQVENMLNDDMIFLLKDGACLTAAAYIQLGDECNTPDVGVTFDGKTTKEGLKEYGIEITVKGTKYWYSGTVTEAGGGATPPPA